MLKILKNSKGSTVTESIMALAVLGIISVPIMSIFSNSVFLEKMTADQLEVNAVFQVARGEVVRSVKDDYRLQHFENPLQFTSIDPTAEPRDNLYSASGNETAYLKLRSGNLTEKYKYKVKYIRMGKEDYGPIASSEIQTIEPKTVELVIELYTSEGKLLKKLKTSISY